MANPSKISLKPEMEKNTLTQEKKKPLYLSLHPLISLKNGSQKYTPLLERKLSAPFSLMKNLSLKKQENLPPGKGMPSLFKNVATISAEKSP